MNWYLVWKTTEHEVVDERCACGIYIAKEMALAQMYLNHQYNQYGYAAVLAKVHGWGRVIEGDDGWRVEYAYPSEIYVTQEQAKQIADYGVPLILLEDTDLQIAIPEKQKQRRVTSRSQTMLISGTICLGAAIVNLLLVIFEGAGWVNKIAFSVAMSVAIFSFFVAVIEKGKK
jgi:hypothetical protein